MFLPCSNITSRGRFVTNPSTNRGRAVELSMSEMKDLTYSRGNESFRQTSYAQNCKGPGGGAAGASTVLYRRL